MSRVSCIVVGVVIALAIALGIISLNNTFSDTMSDASLPAGSTVDGPAPDPGNIMSDAVNACDGPGCPDDVASNVSDPAPPPMASTDPLTDEVETGVGAFTKLPDMVVDTWYTVEFSVAPDESTLSGQTGGQQLASPQPIYVAPVMRVTLHGDPGVEIRPNNIQAVKIGRDKAESWHWNVRPLTDGVRTLYAKVEVLERLSNGTLDTVDTYTRRVEVKVKVGTWKGFLLAIQNASNLGDALATLFTSWEKTLMALVALIAAIGAVLLAVRKLRKPKE